MTYLKAASVALVAALAIYGGLVVSQGIGHLYDDWRFVRASRIQAIQHAQRQQQKAQAKPASVATP